MLPIETLERLAMSHRKGSLRRPGDAAYRQPCPRCTAGPGQSCAHKRAEVRTALIDALAERAAEPVRLRAHLAVDINLVHALQRSPRYHQTLADERFGRLADVYLLPDGARVGEPLLESACAHSHPAGLLCDERRALVRAAVIDSLFPPHYDLIERYRLEEDQAALTALLREHAVPSLDTAVERVGEAHALGLAARVRARGRTAEVHATGLTSFAVRLWRCVACGSDRVRQTAAERCGSCSAPANEALVALPEVLGEVLIHVTPRAAGIADDAVVWLSRARYEVRLDAQAEPQPYASLGAAVAGARRWIEHATPGT